MITEVAEKSPAHEAGLLIGDTLLRLDGENLGGMHELLAALADQMVGKTVVLSLLRAGKITRIEIELGERG